MWIYIEENSNLLDTHVVVDSDLQLVNDEESTFDYDLARTNIQTSIYHHKDIENSGLTVQRIDPLKPDDFISDWVTFLTSDVIIGTNYLTYFSTSEKIKPFIEGSQDLGIKHGSIDSISILGKLFLNVKVFEHLQQSDDLYPKKIYWAKHVGRIRYELHNGEIWNLKSFSVSQ